MPDQEDLATTLARVAREINAPTDLSSTLQAIVQSAMDSLPDIDHVGISMVHKDGTIETMAGTSQLVWDLDAAQYDLQEGPCYDAIVRAPIMVANELRHDQRWPRYVSQAARQGVKAQIGVRLFIEGTTIGGMNMYSTSGDQIDPDVQHLAELFATHAALALGRARQDEDLQTALGTRKVIGQALGIVMERYQLDEDRAFQFLVRVSSQGNVKLRDIAQEIVDRANHPRADGAGRRS